MDVQRGVRTPAKPKKRSLLWIRQCPEQPGPFTSPGTQQLMTGSQQLIMRLMESYSSGAVGAMGGPFVRKGINGRAGESMSVHRTGRFSHRER